MTEAFAATPDTYLYNEKTKRRHLIIGFVQTANPDCFLPIVVIDGKCKVTDVEYPWVVSNWPIAVKHIGPITTEEM